ncbi:MAG TPA: hypothetical protein DDW65_05660 [Firmicutes bacterium]|jgi:hypothetical protein|nr:hypothetical protein [Bacillota bacterium]
MKMVRASCTPGSAGQNNNGGWFDGFVADGDGEGVIPTTDFTYQANGNAMGYDIMLPNGKGLIGFGIGNGQSELNSDTGDINGTALSFYGYSWLSGQTYLEGLISVDSLAFDNRRTFMAGSREE